MDCVIFTNGMEGQSREQTKTPQQKNEPSPFPHMNIRHREWVIDALAEILSAMANLTPTDVEISNRAYAASGTFRRNWP